MSQARKKLLILDGNSLLHRAWHAIPPLTTRDGKVVNAAYGFAMVVDKMLKEHKPEYMAVAWDLPGKTFRHEAVETYKATRVKQPQELYNQIPICKDVLGGYGIPSIEASGFEADDIIGTISNLESKQGFDTLIVTGDLDALQLVDNNTHVLFFVKGVSEVKKYDMDAVKARYGLEPKALIDFKALRGDSSDNVKGVPGVGEKTAMELVKKFGDLDEMYKALEAGKLNGVREKLAENLIAHKRDAIESKMLVTIIRDVKLDFKIDDAKLSETDTERLLELYRVLEFRTLIRKLGKDVPPPPFEGKDVKISNVAKEAIAILALQGQPDLFGGSLEAICFQEGGEVKLVEHPSAMDIKKVLAKFSSAKKIVTHDVKALWHTLGVSPDALPRAKVFDTMLASYLLHSGSRAHDFETVASDALGKSFQPLSVKNISIAVEAISSVAEKFESRMRKDGLLKLFNELEIPTASILYRMEMDGIELDANVLEDLKERFLHEINRLTKKIHKLAGEDFNINSPSQLAEILFNKLKLPTKGIKKTKTGFSTAASELEKLEGEHEIVPLISEYREVAKLQSTYVEALPSLVAKDGRVHTTFNQAVTATGRLSSSDPNLQNIPVRTELGREIRKAFVAPRGKALVSADYSQIELRLAAIMADDKPFIDAFLDGADIHTRTASEIFGVDEEKVSKEQRRAAKAINFGILYGMGPHALARSTGVSFDEAKRYIDKYFEVHYAIADYIAEVKTKIHTEGYVETLSGRRRYIPEIHSGVPQLVAQAERMAVNMPIQGTEADVLKMAMLAAQELISKKYHGDVKMLLQVHDELVFEVVEAVKEKFVREIKNVMEGVVSYKIPMVVDVSSGPNWGEMK
jgi:DNA polymerase-1